MAISEVDPAAKIIHMVRDPRDVAVSCMGYNRRAGVAGAFEPGSENNRQIVEACVRLWLEALSNVVLKKLIRVPNVRDMQSSVVLATIKRTARIPLAHLQAKT